jgi:hypothetical protein
MRNVPARSVPLKTMSRRFSETVGVLAALALVSAAPYGCGVASAPIQKTPPAVATPIAGHVTVSVDKAPTVGDIVPVYVSVANGTDIARAVLPGQVFAINNAGERVAPLPPDEAARQAGGAGELKAVLASAAVSGGVAGAVGAGLGAAAGSAFGGFGGASGAIVGGAIGAAQGVFTGAPRGEDRADAQARDQINALALQREDVGHDFTVSGYVFFPKGDYQRIQMLLVNRETGDTERIERPWP